MQGVNMAVAVKVKFLTLIYSPSKNPTVVSHPSPSNKPVGSLFIPISNNERAISCLVLKSGLNPDVSSDSWDLVKDFPCIATKSLQGEIIVIQQKEKLNPVDALSSYGDEVLPLIVDNADRDRLNEWSKSCKSSMAANLIKHKLRS
jgi:hypothetical protein